MAISTWTSNNTSVSDITTNAATNAAYTGQYTITYDGSAAVWHNTPFTSVSGRRIRITSFGPEPGDAILKTSSLYAVACTFSVTEAKQEESQNETLNVGSGWTLQSSPYVPQGSWYVVDEDDTATTTTNLASNNLSYVTLTENALKMAQHMNITTSGYRIAKEAARKAIVDVDSEE